MAETPHIPEFTLLRSIGRGAYGEVWLARSVTGVHRAVKIVWRERFDEARPFEREFAGLRRFEPVSVGQESQVALLHVGRNDHAGFFYYVMELADDVETGEEIFPNRYVPKTLKELRTRRQRLSSAECLSIGAALTRALAHLHESGLVHRDIKPSNVIFVHGVPKLADIGLVSAMDSSHSFVGTEGFVPPEGPGTAAADVFSLGKVLYEISTGRDRTDFPQLPEKLEELPDRRGLMEINEVILKACDNDPQRRYQSAEAMREDLLLLQAGRSVRRMQVVERRFRFIVKYGVAVTLVSALAIISFLWASAQTRRATQNLARAERAEADAQARLLEAKFNWARANRFTGRPGQRFDSLAELAKIATRTNRLDLRNEAIACLTLRDVRPIKQWTTASPRGAFAFSRDLRLYGTNDSAGNIYIRDTITDEMRHTLPAQGAIVTEAVSSPDGRFVATSDTRGRAWLWTLGESSPRELPFGSNAGLVAFTPDNRSLTVQIGENQLRFLSVTNGAEEQTLSGIAAPRSTAVSPDGERVLCVDKNVVQVRRRRDGALLRSIPLPENVSAIIWHPDNRRFAAAWSKHIGLWEIGSGRQRGLFVGHETTIVGLAFDGNGEWLASASWDRTTRLWQTDTAREVVNLNISGNHLRLSPDGRQLAFQSWDNASVHLYEIADASVARRYAVPSPHFTAKTVFSPDGRWLVAVDGIAPHLYQPPLATPLASLSVAGTASAAFSADGRFIYTCGERGLRRWPVHLSADGVDLQIGPREAIEATYLKSIQYFLLSGDGEWCVTALRQGGPFFAFGLNATQAVVEASSDVSTGHLHDVNRDATLALSVSDQQPHRLQVWNPRAGVLVTNLESISPIQHAAFSPDQRWLAVSAFDAITLWTLPDFQPRHRLPHPETVENRYPVAFSPDGQMLAAVASDREVWLFDVNTGSLLAALPVDRLTAALAFNPAGDALAVTSERGWFQLWNLRLLRERLAAIHLDWAGTPLPPATVPSPAIPQRITLFDGAPGTTAPPKNSGVPN